MTRTPASSAASNYDNTLLAEKTLVTTADLYRAGWSRSAHRRWHHCLDDGSLWWQQGGRNLLVDSLCRVFVAATVITVITTFYTPEPRGRDLGDLRDAAQVD